MTTLGPNFFIIGAAKAATTTLANLLALHPEAAIVQGKEPHFFSQDATYALGWNAYLRLFGHCTNERAIGDASTSYSRIRYHPQTTARIAGHVPDAKIIYMVRHPLERIQSAYVERIATLGAAAHHGSFSAAIRNAPMMLDSSRYWEVYRHYSEVFGESRVKVVWFEDFVAGLREGLADVARFLDIAPYPAIDFDQVRTNARDEVRLRMEQRGFGHLQIDTTWEPATRSSVIEQLRNDNLALLRHFGKPDDHWDGLYTA